MFSHPGDAGWVNYFKQNMVGSKVYNNVKFHEMQNLEWVALEQSPHHIYYVLVDETSPNINMNSQAALN